MEVESRLIVGQRVSQAPNDRQELAPSVAAIARLVESVAAVLADSGLHSEAAVQKVEQTREAQPTGTTVYAALENRLLPRIAHPTQPRQQSMFLSPTGC